MRRKQIGAAAVFLIALIFLGVNIAAVADDLVGEARSLSVLSVSGDEAVVMRGANREIKEAAGMPLGQGTKAKTGAGTNMYLQADEDKTIKMGSSTLVEITNSLPLVETVIVGPVPDTYLNFDGQSLGDGISLPEASE